MVNVDYANAYKEVLIVINNLIKEDYDKIPKEYIDFLESNCNNDYDFKYDKPKSFKEQVMLEYTKYLLFGLFERFGATEEQRMKIKSFKINYNNELEEQKKETSNYDIIFKDRNIKGNTENSINCNMQLIEMKREGVFKRLINNILKLIKRMRN